MDGGWRMEESVTKGLGLLLRRGGSQGRLLKGDRKDAKKISAGSGDCVLV